MYIFRLYNHKFNTIMLYICIVHPQFKESGIPMHSKQVYAAKLRVCLKSLQHIATLVHGCTSESILSQDGEYGRLRTIVSTYM